MLAEGERVLGLPIFAENKTVAEIAGVQPSWTAAREAQSLGLANVRA